MFAIDLIGWLQVVGCIPAAGLELSLVWQELGTTPEVIEGVAWKVITHTPSPDRVNPLNCKLMATSSIASFVY